METIENSMVVDWVWNEIEYGVPDRSRLRRQRAAYEEEEAGGYEENDTEG